MSIEDPDHHLISRGGTIILKEKLAGFKFLFTDKEIRGSAIITFMLALLLVSSEYLYGHVSDNIVFAIIMCAYVEFQYLFLFLLLFNLWRLFGAFRDKRDARKKRQALWGVRIITLILVVFATIFFFYLLFLFNVFLLGISFIAWCVMETVFMCKFATELPGEKARKGTRFLIFSLIMIVYGVYLAFALGSAVASGPVPPEGTLVFGIDATLLDYALTLFLFVFSLATMGSRLMPRDQRASLDFDKMPIKQSAKIRNELVFLFFSLIGFEIIVRVFNVLSPFTPIASFGLYIYYGMKLVLLIPFAIGFGIALLARRRVA
ncbi:MAG: hypothetical protein Q6373_011525 [Candidatus Sigynarchaeota archaeon]